MARSTSCFCNNLRLFVIISCIIFTLHCESSTAAGNPSGDISESVDEYLSFLASATHYTPMEGAGSHGSIGIGFGAGISVHPTPAAGTVYHDQWRDPSKPSARESRSSDSVAMPRVFVHKGLPLPVDLGIGLAKATDNRATIGSAYAQWTNNI